jgi:hypothetical protein
MKPEFPFVVAVWDDAWGDATDSASAKDVDDRHKPTVIQTVGWMLKDDEKGVSIFNERYMDEGETEYRSRTFIPRSLIRSVTPFNLVRPRQRKAGPI